MKRPGSFLGAVATALVVMIASAGAQEAKHYRFAYDQPKITGYGILGDIFADKLKELSKGTMLIDQYPGAQLGQEPQVLQLVKNGDVEFYDRRHDRYELHNRAARLSPARRARLSAALARYRRCAGASACQAAGEL